MHEVIKVYGKTILQAVILVGVMWLVFRGVTDENGNKGIVEISDQLFILDKAYIRYKSQNYVSFTYNNASFTQRINVKKTGMKAAAVLAFMVGLNSLRKVRKNRKGIKKSEKV